MANELLNFAPSGMLGEVFVLLVMGMICFSLYLKNKKLNSDAENSKAQMNKADEELKNLKIERDTSVELLEKMRKDNAKDLDEKAKLIQLQRDLNLENEKVKESNKMFFLSFNKLSESIGSNRPADRDREESIIYATQTVDGFMNYVSQVKHLYPALTRETREDFLTGEVLQFLAFVSEIYPLLNSDYVLKHCKKLSVEFKLTPPTFSELRGTIRELTTDFDSDHMDNLISKYQVEQYHSIKDIIKYILNLDE